MIKQLNGHGDLFALADGELITWCRIDGDETSRCIAFFRREYDDDMPKGVALWLSPGGWEPMSPDVAGIKYPAIALGTFDEIVTTAHGMQVLVDDVQPYTLPTVHTLDVGGSWPSLRVEALKAATVAWQGMSAIRNRDETMLNTADEFLAWLERHPIDAALAAVSNPFDAAEPVPTRPSDREWFDDGRTRALFHELRHTLEDDRVDEATTINKALVVLDRWTEATPPADG